MIEKEAKTKYCPLKPLNDQVSNTCIASDCMMWREYSSKLIDGSKGYRVHGFCGLAGKP